ncbi:MAG TPA: hypothetical protein DCX54_02255 [Flavobacteriales bacterium]|nr:hypothetical protein [Flavobacteriales bacterium]
MITKMGNRFNRLLGILVFCVLTATSSAVMAQGEEDESDCARTLRKAQKAYDDGLIEKVEQMIKPCLEGGQLNQEEQLNGYRLLAQAKLFDDKKDEAEGAMLKFLHIDPEYELQPGIDSKEFSELFSKYHTSPLYTIGVHFGLNWTMVNSYVERGVYNTENEKKVFSPDLSFHFGLRASRYIYDGLNVHLEANYIFNKYTYSHNILGGQNIITASEAQTVIGIPLTFSYIFLRQKKIRPYVFAGFGMRLIMSAEQQDQVKEFPNTSLAPVTGPAIDIKAERNGLNFEGIFGAGTKFKITRGDIFMDARYNIGLNNQRNESSDLNVNDDERLWDFYITDNDFTFNNVYVTVGFNYYLYKPRKKKEKNE